MFPLAQENRLRIIFQFYTKKRVGRARKNVSNGQLPLFELTDEEKRNIIKELTKVAIDVNLSTFESWRTLTDEDLKRTDLTGAKYWIKKNYDLFNNTSVTADKLIDIRQQRIIDTIKNYNRNLNVLKNGEVPKSTLNALKQDIANNRASKEIKDIVKSIENGTYTQNDINNLQKWLNRRNENLARNETGNLYAQECKDLMIGNGIEHFVWHTMKDDRVRPEHAEREGLVFSINDELPGEDFNCRCWAEPIRLN
ncbi:minor capsid protein [Fusobacterium animalis]|uniref:minor capsid protein n=1 Tax=Fusobacterium animalis TaxID=76859 RepID=UPI0030CF8D9E